MMMMMIHFNFSNKPFVLLLFSSSCIAPLDRPVIDDGMMLIDADGIQIQIAIPVPPTGMYNPHEIPLNKKASNDSLDRDNIDGRGLFDGCTSVPQSGLSPPPHGVNVNTDKSLINMGSYSIRTDQKVLHCSWHPHDNCLAVAGSAGLYIYKL